MMGEQCRAEVFRFIYFVFGLVDDIILASVELLHKLVILSNTGRFEVLWDRIIHLDLDV